MKLFFTEFRIGNEIFEGPKITAETYEEAEAEAELSNLIVVGMLDITMTEKEYGRRVLH
jgi:hypothetical protein